MNHWIEDEMFMRGVKVGIYLYQSIVVKAHERKDALIIGNGLYYLQSGRERLEEALRKFCE